ncbi:MAG TPA: T9SS type A sorting domain-containing protein [bacterium (Candidatus Stahlbacteria)]|nr:T9SS type A sorting domain-containing protein [Candidatus Stahlbacteria bacterium]
MRSIKYINGRRWIGLGSGESHDFWGEGLSYYEQFWHIIKRNGIDSNWISDIEIADNGDLFLSHGYRGGSYNRGASWFRDDSICINLNEIKPDSVEELIMVHRLVKDRDGRIWFIQNFKGGLIFFDPDDSTWGYYDSLKTGIPIRGGWDAEFDEYKNMIVSIAVPEGLASALIDPNLTEVIYLPGSVDFTVEIEADSGRYWFAYNTEGLELRKHRDTPFDLSDDEVYYLTKSEGLPSLNGRDLLLDGQGGIYFLCDKGLVYITESDGVFNLTSLTSDNAPFPEDVRLYSLCLDSLGRIWILTNVAIYNYDPDLNTWDIFYFSDLGLDLEFRPIEEFQNHGFTFDYQRGVIWFGSQNGLIKATIQEPPWTRLDSVLVFPNPDTSGVLNFANLPDDARVYIFSLSGRKITELNNVDPVYKRIRWRWQDKTEVRSGIYLALIKSSSGRKVVKFALIR